VLGGTHASPVKGSDKTNVEAQRLLLLLIALVLARRRLHSRVDARKEGANIIMVVFYSMDLMPKKKKVSTNSGGIPDQILFAFSVGF
jgi:hypothetical protein